MRRLVSIVPSSSARDSPVPPSSSMYWPSIEGSDRRPLSGKTVTSLMPTCRGGPGRHQQQRARPAVHDDGAAASRSRRGTTPRGGRSRPGRRGRHRPRRPTGSSSLEGLRRHQRALALDRPLLARRRPGRGGGGGPGGGEVRAQIARPRAPAARTSRGRLAGAAAMMAARPPAQPQPGQHAEQQQRHHQQIERQHQDVRQSATARAHRLRCC